MKVAPRSPKTTSGKRWRWPWDGATTIALAALLLTAIQFALTTPIIVGVWWKPHLLLLQGIEQDTRAFIVINAGRASAHNVEIELQTIGHNKYLDGDILVFPDGGAVISDTDLGKRIAYPRLDPGDSFTIGISYKEGAPVGLTSGAIYVPLFRSDEGPGDIRQAPYDPVAGK